MNSHHTIVVTGATGRQGGAVARHLLAAGFTVHALVRDPDKPAARALEAAGAQLVVGDMLDPFSLCRAFADVHGVFSVQTWRGPGGVEAEKEMGFNVVQCAADAGVPHLVYSSVASANRTDLAHFLSKYEIEQRIAMLGVPATILRPVFFMDNFSMQAEGIRAGRLVQGVKPETRLQMIAVDDIGGIATLAFSSPHHWRGKTFEFAGDELTLVQAAEIFSARLGRPVEYVPEHEDRPGGGDEARRMATWFDEVGYNLYIAGVREVYPALKDFRAFVAQADWLDG
ncbi:MAG: hypothetical protein CVT67_10915 [Actinobacteria bacterium HGW-Actinobacteria-7]|nr:MAG: hypothetical protein CVT67_10915 [Actinobacteria bacterium HGW-Actinobacteria-7]